MSSGYYNGGRNGGSSSSRDYDDRRPGGSRDDGRRRDSWGEGHRVGDSRDYGYQDSRDRPGSSRDDGRRHSQDEPDPSRRDDRNDRRGRGSGRRNDQPKSSYLAPAKKRNYQEEKRLKDAQMKRRMQEQLAQTMMQVQDNIAVRKVNYDSEEEDPMPFDCVPYEVVQSPSKKRRSRTPPIEEEKVEINPLVLEHPEAKESVERFEKPTRNMNIYKKKRYTYASEAEIVQALRSDAEHSRNPYGALEAEMTYKDLFMYDFYPDYELFLNDPIEPEKVLKLWEILNHENVELSAHIPRFHQAGERVDDKNVEKKFRIILLESNGEIPISEDKDDFEYDWEIRERKEREKRDKDSLLALKIEFERDKIPLEEELLQARLKIKNNPKDFKEYLDYCKAEELVYERYKMTFEDPKPSRRRMRAWLRKGIENCPSATQLYIELGLLIIEDSKEHGERYFTDTINTMPLNFALITAYLDAIQFNKSVYCSLLLERAFTFVQNVMKNLLNSREAADYQTQLDIELFSTNLWIRHLQWLLESGNVERVVASIQASFQSSYFSPNFKTFKDLWDLGAPRLGDKNYDPEYNNLTDVRLKSGDFITAEFDDICEEMEKEKQVAKLLENPHNVGKESLFSQIQRFTDEMTCRPLRCEPRATWEVGAPLELVNHVMKRRFIPFEKLAIARFRLGRPDEEGSPLYILSHFGFSFQNESYHYSGTAKKFGLSPIRDALPQRAQLILLRIFAQVLTLPSYSKYTCDLPANIVRYCNTAYPEKEVLIETMKLLDELVAVPSQMREPEINETYLLLTLKELTQLGVVDPLILINKLEDSCHSAARNSGSEIWGRIAFSYMVMIAGLMTVEEFEPHVSAWLSAFYMVNVPNKEDALKILCDMNFQEIPEIPEEIDPLEIISSLPSTTSLSLTLTIYLLNCDPDRSQLRLLQHFNAEHVKYYPEEKKGLQEVHYATLKYLENSMVTYKTQAKIFFDELKAHRTVFPNHQEGIQLFLKHFKNSTPLIMYHLWKTPLCPQTKVIDANASEFEIYARLALFDRTALCQEKHIRDSVDHYLAQQIMKLAEKTRDPNMWRLALKKAIGPFKHIVFECARNKCVWSKALYLDYMAYKQESAILGKDSTVDIMNKYRIPNIGSVDYYTDLVERLKIGQQ